jgi:hypothetical protein
MTSPLSCSAALKEWAVICRALETGRQTVLLRKGGIAEGAGGFRAEYDRFWLYPTQFHQGAAQLRPEFAPLLADVGQLQTADGKIVLRSFATVERVSYLTSLDQALALSGLHGWTDDVVRQRFEYKRPGLYLFVLRVFRSSLPAEIVETATMAGCKSWVNLPEPLPLGELQPALTDEAFQAAHREIQARLAGH